MFSNSIKKALVVAGVALTLPVLSAGTAYADSGNAHGTGTEKNGTASQSASSEHGKGTETDTSGSSTNPDGTFQGKGSSTPDQDGKGMDRGADNNDKTGPGTDGNNGCGNEPRLAAPRDGGRPTDDDNNGWCGSKPKPEHKVAARSADSASVQAMARPVAADVAVPVRVASVVTPAAPALAAPVTRKAAAKVVAYGTVTPLVAARTAAAVRGAGFIGPVAGTGVVAASAAAPTALPFTGAPVGLLLMVSGLLVALGALFALVGTRRTA